MHRRRLHRHPQCERILPASLPRRPPRQAADIPLRRLRCNDRAVALVEEPQALLLRTVPALDTARRMVDEDPPARSPYTDASAQVGAPVSMPMVRRSVRVLSTLSE